MANSSFWKRQFLQPRTLQQLIFDICFGIVGPILCVISDPIVFVSSFGGSDFLQRIRFFAYFEIFLAICVLAYWLWRHRPSLVLAGALYGSALFSVALGIRMLPLTLIGILAIIGILGLTPFVTAFVFLRNGVRSQAGCVSSRGRAAQVAALVLGVALVLGIPIGLHMVATHQVNWAVATFVNGNDQDFGRAEKILGTARSLRLAQLDPYVGDKIFVSYINTSDPKQRQKFARAYQGLTGDPIAEPLSSYILSCYVAAPDEKEKARLAREYQVLTGRSIEERLSD